MMRSPRLSVVIPTFNNLAVLKRCLSSWERLAGDQPVELLVIEDGCKDATPAFLREICETPWGARTVRWFHEDDVHELRCDNRGFREAKGDLMLAWQDDMFLEVPWLVPELIASFDAYPDLGLLAMIRGLHVYPARYPITEWRHLHDPQHIESTLGPGLGLNWLRLAEVDIVVRPWVVRRACVERVGPLDEAYVPTEWDEADLCYRIRQAGWKVGAYGYERLGAFTHLGSTTISKTDPAVHMAKVLPNGQRFRERWEPTIDREHPRQRRTWWRRASLDSVPHLVKRAAAVAELRARRALAPSRTDAPGRHEPKP